ADAKSQAVQVRYLLIGESSGSPTLLRRSHDQIQFALVEHPFILDRAVPHAGRYACSGSELIGGCGLDTARGEQQRRLTAAGAARRVVEIVHRLIEGDKGSIGQGVSSLQIIRNRGRICISASVAGQVDLTRRARLAVEQNVVGLSDANRTRSSADAVLVCA